MTPPRHLQKWHGLVSDAECSSSRIGYGACSRKTDGRGQDFDTCLRRTCRFGHLSQLRAANKWNNRCISKKPLGPKRRERQHRHWGPIIFCGHTISVKLGCGRGGGKRGPFRFLLKSTRRTCHSSTSTSVRLQTFGHRRCHRESDNLGGSPRQDKHRHKSPRDGGLCCAPYKYADIAFHQWPLRLEPTRYEPGPPGAAIGQTSVSARTVDRCAVFLPCSSPWLSPRGPGCELIRVSFLVQCNQRRRRVAHASVDRCSC